MKIAIVGTGYVGLVTGAGFAELGHEVTCIDIDVRRIEALRRGDIPIYEPGLDELVRSNAAAGRLAFAPSVAEGVPGAALVFIAVGTPSRPDGSADLDHVLDAATEIGRALDGPAVIVTKSTVPVGTAERLRELIALVTHHPFEIASAPEFLKEGEAVADFFHPPRVVIGVDDEHAAAALRDAYAGVIDGGARLIEMDVRSAELTKYAANAMLATRLSFMNELAALAEAAGADIEAIREGVGSDPRIGDQFLRAGAGFGGSCFPKDLRALALSGREHDVALTIVGAAERANQRQRRLIGERIIAHFGGRIAGRHVAVWGLAFKPNTDDVRESPALVLIEQLLDAGASVAAHDPVALETARSVLGKRVELATCPYDAAFRADALALITDWRELCTPDLARLRRAMRTPIVFDGRNAWSAEAVRAAGFAYYGIGRGRGHGAAPELIGKRRSWAVTTTISPSVTRRGSATSAAIAERATDAAESRNS
jgi:UDPglucose 6-dehydrogenase